MSHRNSGIIAAGSPQVAEAAAETLRAGGNAFDAAIAAAWASFIAETPLTSAGGAGFMLTHTASGEQTLFDFFSQTPRHKRPESELDFYPVSIDYGGSTQVFHSGLGSIAMPGNVAGLFHVHRRLGRIPFKELIQPALSMARDGFTVGKFFAYCAKLVSPTMTSQPTGKAFFMPDGRLPEEGDTFAIPDFADTLEYLGTHGPEEFYFGEIARKIAEECQNRGGYLTREDFEKYQVIERRPLYTSYRDHVACTNPAPSAGGLLISLTLKLLEKQPLRSWGQGSPKHLQALLSALCLTKQGREERLDPDMYREGLSGHLLDEQYLSYMQAQLDGRVSKIGSTTHFTVADSEGNIASMTSSTGEGSGFAVPGTQIMLNNMLGEEDLNPTGFHKWPANRRITSMMAPTLLLKDGAPVLATGSGGANRIRSVIAQVISNQVDFNLRIEDNVYSPRMHWEDNHLDLEPGFPSASVEALLEANSQFSHRLWEELGFYFGGAHTLTFDKDGSMHGVGDRRRIGTMLRS